MITLFNKGTIWKGSDCEVAVRLSSLCSNVDFNEVDSLRVDFYTTESGVSINKYKEDFSISGQTGTTHFEWEEMEALADGVIRYVVTFEEQGETTVTEITSGYYLKSPGAYTAQTFITEENLNEKVSEAVSAVTSGMATEEYVDEAVVDCYNNVMSSVTETIKENDWTYIIHSDAWSYWEGAISQSEVNAVVNAALTTPITGGRETLRLLIKVNGYYQEFFPLAPYRPYTNYDAYFVNISPTPNDSGWFTVSFLGLSRGQIPTMANIARTEWNADSFQQTLVSGQNIKTINNESLLGSGNIEISSSTENYYVDVSTLTPEQLEQVRGPQGFTGPQGIMGPQGPTGPQGDRGAAGTGNVSSLTVSTLWTGTQQEYEALSGHSNDTLYFIDQE